MPLFGHLNEQIKEYLGPLLRRAPFVIILAFVLFIALGGVSHKERWHIYTVDVTGAVIVPADSIRALAQEKILGNYFWAYARDNSYLFPAREIEQALLVQFPRLETAAASRADAHRIAVLVTERTPYALWCGEEYSREIYELNDCWFIDKSGFVFDKAPIFSEGVYLEFYSALENKTGDEPAGGRIPTARFARGVELIRLLRTDLAAAQRIILKTDGEYDVALKAGSIYPALSGATLYLKDETAPPAVLKSLTAALKEEFPDGTPHKKKLQYVDMRFGNKIFFGFTN